MSTAHVSSVESAATASTEPNDAVPTFSAGLDHQCFGPPDFLNPDRLAINLCDFDCCSSSDPREGATPGAPQVGGGTIVSMLLEWRTDDGFANQLALGPGTYRVFTSGAEPNFFPVMIPGPVARLYVGTYADWATGGVTAALRPVVEGTVTVDALSLIGPSDDLTGGSLSGSCELKVPDHPKVDGHHRLSPTFTWISWLNPSGI